VLSEDAGKQLLRLYTGGIVLHEPLVPTSLTLPIRPIWTQEATARNRLSALDHAPAFLIGPTADNPADILSAALWAALRLS